MPLPDSFARDVPLAPRTTLELGGPAELLLEAADAEAIRRGMAWARTEGVPVHLLGGGSNTLVPDEGLRGLVIDIASRGIEVSRDGEGVRVRVQAGESWDALVSRAVGEGWAGLECLAGIPGRVGATPIQNVGAYGQEVSETIAVVGCLDRETLERVERSPEMCAFGYRDSAFKRNPGRFVVTDVTFALHPGGAPALRYRELSERAPAGASLQAVRDLVVALRRRKSMVLDEADPNSRSAGSFFTNPIVSATEAARVFDRSRGEGLGEVPHWPVPDGVKLAAGWLIEKAGFPRGTRRGRVGLNDNHALSLVHRGGGTTNELLAFADEVVEGVRARFGILLEREPRLMGVDG